MKPVVAINLHLRKQKTKMLMQKANKKRLMAAIREKNRSSRYASERHRAEIKTMLGRIKK